MIGGCKGENVAWGGEAEGERGRRDEKKGVDPIRRENGFVIIYLIKTDPRCGLLIFPADALTLE